MATGSGDPDADAGMGIGVGASGYGGGDIGDGGAGGGGGESSVSAADIAAYRAAVDKVEPGVLDFLGAIFSGGLSVLGGQPLGAVGSISGLAAKYNKARTAARESMKAQNPNLTDAQLDAIEKAATTSIGAGTGAGVGAGANGSDGSTDTTNPINNPDTAQGAANVSLNEMFGGQAPAYDMQAELQKYLGANESALNDYTANNASLADDWAAFEQQFDDIYGGISQQYGDLTNQFQALNDKYNGLESLFSGNQQGFRNTADRYNQQMEAVPGLRLLTPQRMGGGTVPIAPRNHADMYDQQARTVGDLLQGELGSINSQRGAYDSQGDLLGGQRSTLDSFSNMIPTWANALSTGMANRGGINQNQYNAEMGNNAANLLPFETALQLYRDQTQFNNNLALQDSRNQAYEDSQPNAAATWVPAIAAAVSSDAGKGLLDTISSWFN